METSTRIGLFITLGLIIGAIVGRWQFGFPVYGALVGGLIFAGLGYLLDKRARR